MLLLLLYYSFSCCVVPAICLGFVCPASCLLTQNVCAFEAFLRLVVTVITELVIFALLIGRGIIVYIGMVDERIGQNEKKKDHSYVRRTSTVFVLCSQALPIYTGSTDVSLLEYRMQQ